MSARREPMSATKMKKAISRTCLLLTPMLVVALFLTAATAYGAAPGITGTTFHLTAQPAYVTQPDGGMIYSWGYGCVSSQQSFLPMTITPPAGGCSTMQVPCPTPIVS